MREWRWEQSEREREGMEELKKLEDRERFWRVERRQNPEGKVP